MQKIISRYGLAAHLALVAVAPLFLFPYFGDAVAATVLFWLTPLAAVWTLLEPSRRFQEPLHAARARVAKSILRDPLFWLSLVLVGLAACRWINDGIAMNYNAEDRFWFLSEPACKVLPGSVKGGARLPFAISLALVVILQAMRHALGKSARISFLFTASLLAGVAASVACVLAALGNPDAVAAVQIPTAAASFAGSSFGICFLMGLVALAGGFECGWNKYFLLFSFAIGANAAGLWFFAPTPVIGCYLAAGIAVMAVNFTASSFEMGPVAALKNLSGVIIAFGIASVAVMGLAPEGLNDVRLAVFDDGVLFPEPFGQVRELLSGIAAKVWGVHPWLGTGVGSFGLDVKFNVSDVDWPLLRGIGSQVPNAGWQLLAERGILGALGVTGVFCIIAFTFVTRLAKSIRRPLFHPGVWLGPIALAAVIAESFMDSSVFRPEMMLAVAAVLSLSASSLPESKGAETTTEK